MINFSKEIEQCLKTLRNTNNKEQNFQGILFHHFLTKYGEDYEVEMETSRDDEHIQKIIPPQVNDVVVNYRKKEIDLLVYNKNNHKEKYAAELKWVYHRNGRWNCLDMLGPFGDDAFFVDQLKEYAGFTETCSVVVYDFSERTLVQRVVYGENEDIKRAFLGGEFYEERKKGVLMVEDKSYPFVWHDDMVNIEKGQRNKYYIIDFK